MRSPEKDFALLALQNFVLQPTHSLPGAGSHRWADGRLYRTVHPDTGAWRPAPVNEGWVGPWRGLWQRTGSLYAA